MYKYDENIFIKEKKRASQVVKRNEIIGLVFIPRDSGHIFGIERISFRINIYYMLCIYVYTTFDDIFSQSICSAND